MYNKDVVDLYSRVSIGAKVTVTWDRFNRTAMGDPAGTRRTAGRTGLTTTE
jgi:hypothetical protein